MLRRLLKWGLWSSLLLVTSAVALASYVLTTEAGARLALRTAVAQFELPITYGDVSGSIAGRLEVSDLNLEIDGLSARIDHLAVEWRLTELRHRRLHIEFVQISGTRSVLRPEALGGSAPDSTAELQDDERQDGGQVLPIDLIVDVLQLRDAALTVMDVGESYAINLDAAGVIDSFRVEGSMIVVAPEVGTAALEISGTGSDRGIELSRLHADVLDGILQAQGSLVWTPKVEWRANVQADSLTPAQLASTPADWPGRMVKRGLRLDMSALVTRPESSRPTRAVMKLSIWKMFLSPACHVNWRLACHFSRSPHPSAA